MLDARRPGLSREMLSQEFDQQADACRARGSRGRNQMDRSCRRGPVLQQFDQTAFAKLLPDEELGQERDPKPGDSGRYHRGRIVDAKGAPRTCELCQMGRIQFYRA